MQVDEFLNIPEENIVSEVPDDDKIIKELAEIYKNKMNVPANNFEKMTLNLEEALKVLKLYMHFYCSKKNNATNK